MFRLIRFLFSCLVLGMFVWFAVSVPIGKYTLWGHLVRIARTSEAQDLAAGAKDTARDVAKRTVEELRDEPPPPKRKPAHKGADKKGEDRP